MKDCEVIAMDFHEYLDACDSVTCIMSVEKKPDGGYGDIRIVSGNKAYIDSSSIPMIL